MKFIDLKRIKTIDRENLLPRDSFLNDQNNKDTSCNAPIVTLVLRKLSQSDFSFQKASDFD